MTFLCILITLNNVQNQVLLVEARDASDLSTQVCPCLIFCLMFTWLVSFIHIFEQHGLNASCSISLRGPFSEARSVPTHCFMMKSLLVPAWSTMTVEFLLTVWQDPSVKARETQSSSTPAMSEYIIAPGILNVWMGSRLSQLGGGGEQPELCAD